MTTQTRQEGNQYVALHIDAYMALHNSRQATYCTMIPVKKAIRGHYIEIDNQFSINTAKAYAQLPLTCNDGITLAAYKALASEIQEQYDYAVSQIGITFEAWLQDGEPYANSAEMCADVKENRHLYYFTGGTPNDFMAGDITNKFRAIHDLFGHCAEGYQFGPRGEFNAWLHHSMMFSELAQLALTVETHGQNSWFNFGPNAHLPLRKRPFAVQKFALLPSKYCNWKRFFRA